MKVLIITSSPNKEGLTAACGEAARQGVVDSRSRARLINLNEFEIQRCAVCEDGWGPCRTKHRCRLVDDFGDLQSMLAEAEGLAPEDGHAPPRLDALVADARAVDAAEVFDLDALAEVDARVPARDRRVVDAKVALLRASDDDAPVRRQLV